jgi:hypothetical protein
METPKDYIEYIEWWNRYCNPKIGLPEKKLYDFVTEHVRYNFENSPAYKNLIQLLSDYDAEYRLNCGFDLLMVKPEDNKITPKEWKNFISKVRRKNIILNNNFDTSDWDFDKCKPKDDWITPDNWFERIHDIVRTTIVVKYFDGVEFILNKLCEHFEDYNYKCQPDWEAREEGYYAAHLNVITEYEIPVDLNTLKKNISVEIQVTTQIKDVISKLTHKYYEYRRECLVPPDTKWQWNYKSEEFTPNYIGHILHYIEGTIMQVRNMEKKDDVR